MRPKGLPLNQMKYTICELLFGEKIQQSLGVLINKLEKKNFKLMDCCYLITKNI
jgi:hypothetical protein